MFDMSGELEGQLSSAGDDNKEKLESEIKELSDLLPDIDSKVHMYNNIIPITIKNCISDSKPIVPPFALREA